MKLPLLITRFILISIFFRLSVNESIAKEYVMIHETEHFTLFIYEENPVYLEELVRNLEDNYFRIVSSLGMEGELPKTVVKIYPTIEAFHKGVNMKGAPNWALGTISGSNEFSIASPTSPDLPVSYQDMTERLPVHEFTHVVVYNIVNPEQIPYWLWEGISLYMAGQRVDLSRLDSVRDDIFPSFEEMNSMQNSFRFGYSLVEFIIDTWGVSTLKDLLLNRGNIELTYDTTTGRFNNEWREYVKSRYLCD